MAQDGAAVKTTVLTNLDASPGLKADPSAFGAKVHAQYGTYTFAASTAQYVTMARVPIGARISPNSRLRWAALGSSTSLSVGDQHDSDRFKTITATVIRSSAYIPASGACEWFDGVDADGNYKYMCEQDIRVYTGGVSASMTGQVQMWLEYTLDT